MVRALRTLMILVGLATFINLNADPKGEIFILSQSSSSVDETYLEEACALGSTIAKSGYTLRTMASLTGSFSKFIDGALKAEGDVRAVIPGDPNELQQFRTELTNKVSTTQEQFIRTYPDLPLEPISLEHSFLEILSPQTKAVVLYPGGVGAMKCFLDLIQHKVHTGDDAVRLVVYDYCGYWKELLSQLEKIGATGFQLTPSQDLFTVIHDQTEMATFLSQLAG